MRITAEAGVARQPVSLRAEEDKGFNRKDRKGFRKERKEKH